MSGDLYTLLYVFIFPGGLFLLLAGLMLTWANKRLLARLHNRVGPRWYQPVADTVKLMGKQDIVAGDTPRLLLLGLPVLALAGALTAGLFVPLLGLSPVSSAPGDLIVVLYLLSLGTFAVGLLGLVVRSQFTALGSSRVMTQLFAYEVPFFVALLGPAFAAGTWQLSEIMTLHGGEWLLLTQPIGFVVAVISLMGKLELAPFDAPAAKTEIVAGPLTEYSGRGLALFKLAKGVTMVIGLTLVAVLYLGGVAGPVAFLLKVGGVLAVITGVQVLLTRLRIDQTVTLWWRYGLMLVFVQWVLIIVLEVLV